jgi:hypothetical protein
MRHVDGGLAREGGALARRAAGEERERRCEHAGGGAGEGCGRGSAALRMFFQRATVTNCDIGRPPRRAAAAALRAGLVLAPRRAYVDPRQHDAMGAIRKPV